MTSTTETGSSLIDEKTAVNSSAADHPVTVIQRSADRRGVANSPNRRVDNWQPVRTTQLNDGPDGRVSLHLNIHGSLDPPFNSGR